MRTERELQEFLKREAKRHGLIFHKLESRSTSGFPDCLLVSPIGKIVFVELKSPSKTGRLSRKQKIVIRELRDHCADVRVLDSAEGVIDVITEIAVKD